MPKLLVFTCYPSIVRKDEEIHIAFAIQWNALRIFDLLKPQRIGNYVNIIPGLLSVNYVETQRFMRTKVNFFM